MLIPFLGLIGWPFVLLFLAYSGVMLWVLGTEEVFSYKPKRSLVTTGVGAGILVLFCLYCYGSPLAWSWSAIWTQFRDLLWLLAIYFLGCGPTWVLYKWFLVYSDKCKAEYEKLRDAWLRDHKLTPGVVPDDQKPAFRKFLWEYESGDYYARVYPFRDTRSGEQYAVQLAPKWLDNKARVFSWWILWPWSLASYLCWDFLRDMFNRVFRAVSTWMDSLSRWRFRDVEKDIK